MVVEWLQAFTTSYVSSSRSALMSTVQAKQVLRKMHYFVRQFKRSINPPASLILRSLSLLILTTLSISHPNAQHHASLSTLLLALNTTILWLADKAGIGAVEPIPWEAFVHDWEEDGGLRYQITKRTSSSGCSISRPSSYRRGKLGDSGLYSLRRRASAARYPEQTYASRRLTSFERR
jgi:hypothetical protein